MINKEQNFISAVVDLGWGEEDQCLSFLQQLNGVLNEHFLHYEIIGIRGKSLRDDRIRNWAKGIEAPVTLLTMSVKQPHEQCMNAGLDISIGDYVYEFDTTESSFAPELIWNAYETAMEGNDIVSVCPEKSRNRTFYKLFNRFSSGEYEIRTEAFRLVSRRGINRVHSINENQPYRKAAYAACGLKMAVITFDGQLKKKQEAPFRLAVDSLVLYTDFGYRFSIGLTALMLLAAFCELVYTLVIWIASNPISGWTTTMFVITTGFAGLFAVLTIMLKYLSLLLSLSFRKQSYLVENIEKL